MAARFCPRCGAALAFVTEGEVAVPIHTGYHRAGTPLEVRLVQRPFYACTGCEFCAEPFEKELTVTRNTDAARIALLNDRFRSNVLTGNGVPGRIMMTRGLVALPEALMLAALAKVQQFNTFTPDNDPWHEHDCGRLKLATGEPILWKIDYYADASCTAGAEDPADIRRSFRVLTVMLASEY